MVEIQVMKRLNFVLPSLLAAQVVIDELLLKRININHIHVVGNVDTALGDLPEATVLLKSDLIPAMERGLSIGTITGLLAGIAAIIYPPTGFTLGISAVFGAGLIGAGLGALLGGMIGANQPNRQITPFADAIAEGGLLMTVLVPPTRIKEIEAIINQHQPNLESDGLASQFAIY